MEYSYFAQVTDGVVTDLRKTTTDFMSQNPDMYPGDWVKVDTVDQYPALGWSWSSDTGFVAPPPAMEE